jgi:hypothetical protein
MVLAFDFFVNFKIKIRNASRLETVSVIKVLSENQTCAESHFYVEKSSQVTQKSSHDFDFFGNL